MRNTTLFATLTLMVTLVIAVGIALGGGDLALQDGTPTPVPPPVLGEFDPATVAEIDLIALPLVPEIDERAVALYDAALEAGRDPGAFVKVGDCMTDHPGFLAPISAGDYDLGDYADLQAVIDHYGAGEVDVFARKSQAAAGGFNTASILDGLWANPDYCEAGESPLACEFRLANPSVALIMFGTNDLSYLSEAQYDFFLRSIIAATLDADVLPILSTFPLRPEFPEQTLLFNQISAQVAADYGIPLINLYAALDPLPNSGIDEVETTHMSEPSDGAVCHFIDANLEAGFTVRNLLTLQTLAALQDAVAVEDVE